MAHEIRCSKCSFRVHDRYFEQKQRFSRTSCPNCGSSIHVVTEGTDDPDPTMVLDRTTGRIRPA